MKLTHCSDWVTKALTSDKDVPYRLETSHLLLEGGPGPMHLTLYLLALLLSIGIMQGSHTVDLNNIPVLNWDQALNSDGLVINYEGN